MTHSIRITCAAVGFTLITLIAADPGATATFSEWSTPVNLGATINTSSGEIGPAISKDGLSLYFNSDRPGGFGGQDLWVSQRASVDAPWGTPQNLGPVVNSGALDAVPSFSRDEHWLFFNSNREGGSGELDLWVSYRAHKHDDFAWEVPVNLGPGVNSEFNDAGAGFFENDEGGRPLLFFVSTRPGGFGNFDIDVVAATAAGSLGPPTLVPELSSAANDRRPSVRFDGREVFFDSDRAGSLGSDLWVSTRETPEQAWSTPTTLGLTVNSTAEDLMPNIAADRKSLFFTSNRPGGSGGFDLYVTTRTKAHKN
jgi:Tol biopolymer transport system component